ncbi:hypothetical protein [Microvirga arabica]|uniref:hypothetical protein n=1 Tax=Microvirga arabica TaxID=1128671 RepID=UPI00193AAD85|nr:hypothetical protein [Microvirga arabica]MBM1171272.1 hypothetical protein [Microvirga arabica]
MTAGRSGSLPLAGQQKGETAGSRPVNLEGDSPEIVAFALLRYLAQLEQTRAHETGIVFDREWLLNAYADCLDTVKGNRPVAAELDAAPAPESKVPASGRASKTAASGRGSKR